MKKFEQFQKEYDDAISLINQFLEPSKHEPQMNGLVRWMMETDANPYSYLPEQWANSMSTAEGFASLLGVINHALYDDGEITFVTVNDRPRIVFVWKHEDNFRDYVLTAQEKDIEKNSRFRKVRYDVKVLDITPDEFGPLYDACHVKELKRYFASDVVSLGPKVAVEHYSKHQVFDKSWLDECKEEIADFEFVQKKLMDSNLLRKNDE